jgi:hypothetical protein
VAGEANAREVSVAKESSVIPTIIDPVTVAPDPVVEWLVKRGMRVTRKNYIAFAYTEPKPELDAESEAITAEALRDYRAAVAAEKAIRRARRLR